MTLLRTKDAAAKIGFTKNTLDIYRRSGNHGLIHGIHYFGGGNARIRWDEEALLHWACNRGSDEAIAIHRAWVVDRQLKNKNG